MPGSTAQFYKHVNKSEVAAAMKRFLYLGDVNKIRTALANEFSPDTPLPSAKAIQNALDLRKGIKHRNTAQRRVGAA
jgi:hypothetical protein